MSWRQEGCYLPYYNKNMHYGDPCNSHFYHNFVWFLEKKKNYVKKFQIPFFFIWLFRLVSTFKRKMSLLHDLADQWKTAITNKYDHASSSGLTAKQDSFALVNFFSHVSQPCIRSILAQNSIWVNTCQDTLFC